MFKATTPVSKLIIQVSFIDLMRFLFVAKKPEGRSKIIDNHFYEFEKLRHEGFSKQEKDLDKLAFMPRVAMRANEENQFMIVDNINTLLDILDDAERARKTVRRGMLLPPIVALILYLVAHSPFALVGLALYIVLFGMYSQYYVVTVEKIAERYYEDGRLRRIVKHTDKKQEHVDTYNLSARLL